MTGSNSLKIDMDMQRLKRQGRTAYLEQDVEYFICASATYDSESGKFLGYHASVGKRVNGEVKSKCISNLNDRLYNTPEDAIEAFQGKKVNFYDTACYGITGTILPDGTCRIDGKVEEIES